MEPDTAKNILSSAWLGDIKYRAEGIGCREKNPDIFRSVGPHDGRQYKEIHNWMISYSEQWFGLVLWIIL